MEMFSLFVVISLNIYCGAGPQWVWPWWSGPVPLIEKVTTKGKSVDPKKEGIRLV